jgi:hypothetical protein
VSLVTDMIVSDVTMQNDQRLKDIGKRWNAYYGELPRPLKVKPGQSDDNVRINKAGRVVDEGVSFLFSKDLDFQVGSPQAAGDDDPDAGPVPNPAYDWLQKVWTVNHRMTLLNEAGINGGVAGHAYLRVQKAKTAENPSPWPRLVLIDPATVSAIWDPHDYKKVLQWVIQWNGMDPATRKPCAYRQLVTLDDGGQSWRVLDQESPESSRVWYTTGDVPWPHPWSPIFHCQNLPAPNQFYGVSDLEDDVIEMANAVNFVATNTNRIIRIHAHPKTWGTGFTLKTLEIGVDGMVILPSKDAVLKNLEMQSDLTSSIEFFRTLKDAFHEVSRTPEIATGRAENLGQLSGLALKVLYGPLLRKNGVKQRLYGDMLIELCQRLLELGGFGADADVSITWPDPLPEDPMAQRQAAESDERLGASKATILESLGYDAKKEAQRKKGEQESMGDQMLGAFDKGQPPNA